MQEAIIGVVLYAACVGFGAVQFLRFYRTRGRGYAWAGLALVFGPPWLLFLYAVGTEFFAESGRVVLAIEAAYAVCALVSVIYFRRFLKTRSRRAMWTGLSLLFGPPGLLMLWVAVASFLADETPPQPATMMCYMPSIGDSSMEQIQRDAQEEQNRNVRLSGTYGGRVSTETFHKLSGGIFDEKPSNVDGALKTPGK